MAVGFSTNHPNMSDADVVKGAKGTLLPSAPMKGRRLQLSGGPSQLEPCQSGDSPHPTIITPMVTATAAAAIPQAPPGNRVPSQVLWVNIPSFTLGIVPSITEHCQAHVTEGKVGSGL